MAKDWFQERLARTRRTRFWRATCAALAALWGGAKMENMKTLKALVSEGIVSAEDSSDSSGFVR